MAVLDNLLALPDAARWPAPMAKVLNAAGDIAQWRGHYAQAQRHFSMGLAVCRESEDRAGVIAMQRGLGSVALDLGDLELAETLLSEVLANARPAGVDWTEALAAQLLAILHYTRGYAEAACQLSQDAVSAWQELGDAGHVAAAQAILARSALAVGDLAVASQAASAAASHVPGMGDDALVSDCLELAAGFAELQRTWRQMARYLTAAEALCTRIGVSRWPAFQTDFERMQARARQALGTATGAAGNASQAGELDAAISEMVAMFASGNLGNAADTVAGLVLSPRQREVLALLVAGHSDREIAAALFISQRTASNHVAAVIARLNARTRAEAAIMAVREGLVEGGLRD